MDGDPLGFWEGSLNRFPICKSGVEPLPMEHTEFPPHTIYTSSLERFTTFPWLVEQQQSLEEIEITNIECRPSVSTQLPKFWTPMVKLVTLSANTLARLAIRVEYRYVEDCQVTDCLKKLQFPVLRALSLAGIDWRDEDSFSTFFEAHARRLVNVLLSGTKLLCGADWVSVIDRLRNSKYPQLAEFDLQIDGYNHGDVTDLTDYLKGRTITNPFDVFTSEEDENDDWIDEDDALSDEEYDDEYYDDEYFPGIPGYFDDFGDESEDPWLG